MMNTAPKPIITTNLPPPSRQPDEAPTFVLPEELPWEMVLPELGERSPKHAVVRHDQTTSATTMLIWIPPNFHVPFHWHSGNEKHVVIRGTLIMDCQGRQVVMKPGTFNYMPARTIHRAWTPPDEDCLLLNDVDALWDLNWLNAPPSPEAVGG